MTPHMNLHVGHGLVGCGCAAISHKCNYSESGASGEKFGHNAQSQLLRAAARIESYNQRGSIGEIVGMQTTKQRADQVGAAVFIIGLGIIALLNYWWPGIMFVIGAGLLANEFIIGEGKLNWTNNRVIGACVVILIGLTGVVNFNLNVLWPLILIGLGVAILFGRNNHNHKDIV